MNDLTFAAEYAIDGDTLSGVVHVFGTRTLRDGLLHEFSPDAFGKSKPTAFYSHDTAKPLGKPKIDIADGKMTFSLTLGHQSYANDLRENLAAGLMDKMSFGVRPVAWTDTKTRSGMVRLHTKSDLFDISPVTIPAFEGTGSQLHSGSPDDRAREAARARARVAGGKRNG
jgi:HK97 family phage prohead protease